MNCRHSLTCKDFFKRYKKHHQGRHPKMALASRFDDGSESLILIINRSLYFKSVKCLVALVSQNVEWRCARRCVVKNHTSHSCIKGGRSYTRHPNWNVKVRQYPMPYPFNNSVVTWMSCIKARVTRSPIELQNRISLSRAANKELNPQRIVLTLDNALSRYYTCRKGLWGLQF